MHCVDLVRYIVLDIDSINQRQTWSQWDNWLDLCVRVDAWGNLASMWMMWWSFRAHICTNCFCLVYALILFYLSWPVIYCIWYLRQIIQFVVFTCMFHKIGAPFAFRGRLKYQTLKNKCFLWFVALTLHTHTQGDNKLCGEWVCVTEVEYNIICHTRLLPLHSAFLPPLLATSMWSTIGDLICCFSLLLLRWFDSIRSFARRLLLFGRLCARRANIIQIKFKFCLCTSTGQVTTSVHCSCNATEERKNR